MYQSWKAWLSLRLLLKGMVDPVDVADIVVVVGSVVVVVNVVANVVMSPITDRAI